MSAAEGISSGEGKAVGGEGSSEGDDFYSFLVGELHLNRGLVKRDYTVQSQRVWNFLRLISVLERLVMFGFVVCFDHFMFCFTFLPLRALGGAAACVRERYLSAHFLRDVSRLALIGCCFVALGYMDMGKLYHTVRNQSFIKLYVIFNMLTIFAKLLYSLGEDLLDALYGTCSEGLSLRYAVTFAVTAGYMSLHAFFICLQVVTLNVCVNSNDKTLFVLLSSSQFVELKSFVFKRFGQKNLFQLAMSDVVERFELSVFMCILIAQNGTEIGMGTAAFYEWLRKAASVACLMYASECLVDWLKHGFIIKFNMIDPGIYAVYHLILCVDITREADPSASMSSMRTMLRRFGFVPIPLVALCIRVLWDNCKFLNPRTRITVIAVLLANFMALKLLVRIWTLGHACNHVAVSRRDAELHPNSYLSRKVKSKGRAKSSPARSPGVPSDMLLRTPDAARSPDRVDVSLAGPSSSTPGEGKASSQSGVSAAIAEHYTSMYAESYKPIEAADKLANVARYALIESRVP